MKNKEIKELLFEEAKERITKFLESDIQEIRLPFLKPKHIFDILKEMGLVFRNNDSFESNGWSWDYSIEITINDNEFSLYGDGYYDDNCVLSRII